MKTAYVLMPVLALGAAAAAVERRNAAAINSGALSLIEGLEGFRSNFYTINGHKTIGYGHDCVERGCSGISAPISQAEGAKLLRSDLTEYESCVCGMANAKDLNANQYGALVSFAYNSGCGGVQSWWHGAMAKKNFKGICEALPTTNTLGGELSNRRKQEGHFCGIATTAKSGCA